MLTPVDNWDLSIWQTCLRPPAWVTIRHLIQGGMPDREVMRTAAEVCRAAHREPDERGNDRTAHQHCSRFPRPQAGPAGNDPAWAGGQTRREREFEPPKLSGSNKCWSLQQRGAPKSDRRAPITVGEGRLRVVVSCGAPSASRSQTPRNTSRTCQCPAGFRSRRAPRTTPPARPRA